MLAPNPSPLTLDGTNTWVLQATPQSRSVVIDPGPADSGHLDAVAAAAGGVAVVLLTHGHLDHSASARAFALRYGCGVRAFDPRHQLESQGLDDGDLIEVDGLEISVLTTPGHTADSVSFVVPADGAVLTGDTVLGRGTSVVAHPDGQLGAYLDSLRRLRDLAGEAQVRTLWPGHGPVIGDPLSVIDAYLVHRAERLDQVRAALQGGAVTPRDVVARVYADVDPVLWPAAEQSAAAQLAYLRDG